MKFLPFLINFIVGIYDHIVSNNPISFLESDWSVGLIQYLCKFLFGHQSRRKAFYTFYMQQNIYYYTSLLGIYYQIIKFSLQLQLIVLSNQICLDLKYLIRQQLITLMNDLRLLYQVDKQKKIINLEYKQISSLEPLLPILAKFQNLESLSLYGNRLKTLPTMEMLLSLVQIDLSNNLFSDVKHVIKGLKSLPSLRHLIYTFKNDEQEQQLKNELPNLQRINKKPLNNKIFVKKAKKKSQLKLQEKDLQQIGQIYDDIRGIYKGSKYMVDKQLMSDFDKSVDIIMTDLSIQLNQSKSQTEIDSSIITCRYGLIDMCFTKVITYFYHFDKNVAVILEKIHDYMAESFRSIGQIMKIQEGKSMQQLSKVKIKKQELYKSQIKRLKTKEQTLIQQNQFLENKNNQLLRILAEYGKNKIGQNYIRKLLKNNDKLALTEKKQSNNLSKSRSNRRKSMSPLKSEQHQKGQKQTELDLRKMSKSLSVNQLKEVITQIYASKNKQDKICMQSGLPMQTMEQYMYTFLNQKYGLKSLTIQWAMGIVSGIKKYGSKQPQIAIFGKVLRNQIEQSYHQNLKKTRTMIKAQYKKFKGTTQQRISLHQAEQILLNCRYQRDVIALIMPKIRQDASATDGKVTVDRFQSAVLDYVLRVHQQQIKFFAESFKQVDTNNQGWLTRPQLLKLVDKSGKQVDADLLFQQIDPFMTDKLTFSWIYERFQKDEAYSQLLHRS